MDRMLELIVAVTLLASLILFAACGDDGSSPTPSLASLTPTPEPVACTASHLYGALVSTKAVSGTSVFAIGVSSTLGDCALSGAPTVNWYDEGGALLAVPAAAANSKCPAEAPDYATCVFEGEVSLPAGAATPAPGFDGSITATIAVKQDDACTTSQTAHFLGLQFPGVSPDVQVELTGDVVVPTCGESVTLQSYGPTNGVGR